MLEDYGFKESNSNCKCINCRNLDCKKIMGTNKKIKIFCKELSNYEQEDVYVSFTNICDLWQSGPS